MISHQTVTVTGATLLGNGKWPQLRLALEPVIRDTKLKKLVLVSTDKANQESVRLFAKMYKEKIVLHEEDLSSGRAFLFSKLINSVKEQYTDYMLFLEDDAVPEDDFIDSLLDNLKYFKENDSSHVILIGNTVDIFGKEKSFYSSSVKKDFKDGTLFDLLAIKKIWKMFKYALHIENGAAIMPPLFRTQAYVGGGTFIPRKALESAENPNSELYMYGEDTDYAWKLKEAGFNFYQCLNPIIRKHSSETRPHHVFGLFNKSTPDYEAYYRMRNAVLISRTHTYQSKAVLLFNIILWITAASILGIRHATSVRFFFHRVKLLITAIRHGYNNKKVPPVSVTLNIFENSVK